MAKKVHHFVDSRLPANLLPCYCNLTSAEESEKGVVAICTRILGLEVDPHLSSVTRQNTRETILG